MTATTSRSTRMLSGALGGVDGPVGDRGEAVEQAGADLAGPSSGEDLQQDHAHGLRVVEAAGGDLLPVASRDQHVLVAAQAEQGQGGGDVCERVVVDVVLVVEIALVRDAGDLKADGSGSGSSTQHPLSLRFNLNAVDLGVWWGCDGRYDLQRFDWPTGGLGRSR
ncbi:hypothetical protein ACH47Z_42130, partial [Streptomyces sp. NPDC020192]|uniref:hypothetical protein n=1 Tax=Streptomyces sp. NPDC020192 TaxID=3365066 RepID=UPI00379E6D44